MTALAVLALVLLRCAALSRVVHGHAVADWPNVLENTWLFDLGSQAGYRTANNTIRQRGDGSTELMGMEGPGPDWAVRTGEGTIPVVRYGLSGSGVPSSAAVATTWPGAIELRQRWAKDVTATAHLAFVTANTTVVKLSVHNAGSAGATVSLLIRVAAGDAKPVAGGVDFRLPAAPNSTTWPDINEYTCFQAPDFTTGGIRALPSSEFTWSVSAHPADSEILIRSSKLNVGAGAEVAAFASITTGTSAFCDAEAARIGEVGPAASRGVTAQRWERSVAAVLKNRPPLTATSSKFEQNLQWSAVKALMTLVSNWRYEPNSGLVGVVPSYTTYDGTLASLVVTSAVSTSNLHSCFRTIFSGFHWCCVSTMRSAVGFWSWDTYKQAVATAIWDPDLARNQLRLIVAARNTSTGHITDLVDRCGRGTGCPGKPTLLSWAVAEIYNLTMDKAFVEEMYALLLQVSTTGSSVPASSSRGFELTERLS